MLSFNLEHALEALIFAAPEPITMLQIMAVLESQGHEYTKEAVQDALLDLRERETGVAIQETAGGFVYRTVPEYGDLVRALLKEKPQKLSPSQLEILSVVSYRQPVTRLEIEDIRGVDCSSALKRLLMLKLVKIMGKSQAIGRPLLYGTTKEFLEFFGFSSLHELPSLREYQDLNKDEKEPELKEEDPNVVLKDLFGNNDLFSEDKERDQAKALEELDKAMGALKKTEKEQGLKEESPVAKEA